uniref:DUF7869 domain-containing protein n=1 Tax=Schizaphis graminum TaxID=13262 RepID=A0A2S2NKT1_SCHGA
MCITKKKNSVSAITEPDQRGKHAPSNKLSDNIIEHVKNHIRSFPSYSSHYSRERTKRKYLGPDMNISRMYQAYIDECEKSCIESTLQTKEWMYRKIFNEQFNLSFHPPYNDTCDECDRLILSEKQENSAEQKLIIANQRDQHLIETTLRCKLKKEDKIKSNENKDTTVFITMDMQKCLPVPFLHNCQSFYLRKLWVLNETIEDSTNNKSFAFMWDETKAARGANEIASVLYKWIENEVQHKSTINEVNLWTDNCAGQNRNLTIVMAYFWFLFKYPNLQEINHKFLLRGHTHLEVDSVHSVIERKKKRFPLLSLSVPKEWEQFVETARVKNPITVHSMEIEDFKNFCIMEIMHHLSLAKKMTMGIYFTYQKLFGYRLKKII